MKTRINELEKALRDIIEAEEDQSIRSYGLGDIARKALDTDQSSKAWRYGERIDPHIYGVKDGALNRVDWLAVALAALDQADFTDKETIQTIKDAMEL